MKNDLNNKKQIFFLINFFYYYIILLFLIIQIISFFLSRINNKSFLTLDTVPIEFTEDSPKSFRDKMD